MKTKHLATLAACVIAAAPAIYLLAVQQSIPEKVALHFNINGKADRYGTIDELWILCLIIAGAGLAVYFLLANIQGIDPKRTAGGRKDVFVKLGLITATFLALLNIIFILSAVQGQMLLTHLLLPAIGLMLAVFGNYMPKLKPNYFAGIRLPWTLENEDNWRITHQVAGKWWFWGGLLMALLTALLPATASFIVMISITTIIVAVPVYTSWRIFQQQKKSST